MKMIALEEQNNNAGRNHSASAREYCDAGAGLRIEQSLAYMAQHLDQPLQVATLAAQANISPSYFFALFKRRIGSAPMDYFTRLRMQHACRLLEETPLSVKEVASELGYDDPFYFSRVFKSVNGVAPTEYRTMSKEWKQTVNHSSASSNSPARTNDPVPEPGRQPSQMPVLEPLKLFTKNMVSSIAKPRL